MGEAGIARLGHVCQYFGRGALGGEEWGNSERFHEEQSSARWLKDKFPICLKIEHNETARRPRGWQRCQAPQGKEPLEEVDTEAGVKKELALPPSPWPDFDEATTLRNAMDELTLKAWQA